MTIALLFATLSLTQGVSPEVASFIKTFSYAATNVDLVPDSKGNYPHKAELAKTLLTLQGASDETMANAFELLDKNESERRLIAGDLLLLIDFDVPVATDWKSHDGTEMRNILQPTGINSQPSKSWTSSEWPWHKGTDGKWTLGSYSLSDAPWNESLVAKLGLFKGKYKRRAL